MSDTIEQHERLLKQHGFELVRATKHHVFRNPEGRVYVTSSTPSDWRVAHNRLTALKRCLASPVQPFSLAISQFEREEAAFLIEGRKKVIPGAGGGGSRSRGTGFIYDDAKILTVAQLAQSQATREQAIANRKRRQEAQNKALQGRRAKKLSRLQAEALAEEKFRRDYQPTLDAIEGTLVMLDREFLNMFERFGESREWKEPLYYEFPTADDELAETWAHNVFLDHIDYARDLFERGEFRGCGCIECLNQTELNVLFIGDYLIPKNTGGLMRSYFVNGVRVTTRNAKHDSEAMVNQIVRVAERQLRCDKSADALFRQILIRAPKDVRSAAVCRQLVRMMCRWSYDEKFFTP